VRPLTSHTGTVFAMRPTDVWRGDVERPAGDAFRGQRRSPHPEHPEVDQPFGPFTVRCTPERRWIQFGIRTFGASMAIAAAGYVSLVAAAYFKYGDPPAEPEGRSPDRVLDRFMPTYEVVERHSVRVHAPAHLTLTAALEQDLQRSRFASFWEPNFVKIVVSLRADPLGAGDSLFRSETRAVATDGGARVRFRRYWSFVSPGVALMRHSRVSKWCAFLRRDEGEPHRRSVAKKGLKISRSSRRIRLSFRRRASSSRSALVSPAPTVRPIGFGALHPFAQRRLGQVEIASHAAHALAFVQDQPARPGP
jgi:hypothetical protein